jgi:hypothetical protein
MASKDQAADSVATEAQNEKLEHSQGGVTTRSDALDAGVPMMPGDPSEPVGPEDALGIGPKRGDYSGRVGPAGYEPHQSVPVPDAKPGEPRARLEAQAPRTADRGDAKGQKGGVDTAPAR